MTTGTAVLVEPSQPLMVIQQSHLLEAQAMAPTLRPTQYNLVLCFGSSSSMLPLPQLPSPSLEALLEMTPIHKSIPLEHNNSWSLQRSERRRQVFKRIRSLQIKAPFLLYSESSPRRMLPITLPTTTARHYRCLHALRRLGIQQEAERHI